MQSTKYGASKGAKSKWADVEVAKYQRGSGHIRHNLWRVNSKYLATLNDSITEPIFKRKSK